MTQEEQKKLQEDIKDKVLAEWEKGNVCALTSERNIVIQPLQWFLE